MFGNFGISVKNRAFLKRYSGHLEILAFTNAKNYTFPEPTSPTGIPKSYHRRNFGRACNIPPALIGRDGSWFSGHGKEKEGGFLLLLHLEMVAVIFPPLFSCFFGIFFGGFGLWR